MSTGYQDDLAYIHDAGYGDFARRSAPEVAALLTRRGLAGGRVVELGCGSGLTARALVDDGFDVVGIDQSPALIERARGRVPEAEFRVGSFLGARLPRCAAVLALGEVFSYLFDDRNGPGPMGVLFGRIAAALRPGGVLLFDVVEPGPHFGKRPRQVHRVADDWAILVDVERDPSRPLLTRRITSFRRVGDAYRRADEVHRLRLYGRDELVPPLEAAGFRVRVGRRYGRFALPPGRAAYRAEKA